MQTNRLNKADHESNQAFEKIDNLISRFCQDNSTANTLLQAAIMHRMHTRSFKNDTAKILEMSFKKYEIKKWKQKIYKMSTTKSSAKNLIAQETSCKFAFTQEQFHL